MSAPNILEGKSTAVVKLSVEKYIFTSPVALKMFGTFQVTAAATGTYTASGTAFDAGGNYLAVRAATAIQLGSADIVVTVSGMIGGSPDSATATIKATGTPWPEDQAATLLKSASPAKFTAIASVTITGGTLGDGFEIWQLPDELTFTEQGYVNDVNAQQGQTVKPIPNHFDPVDHNKRIRAENRLSVSQWYVSNLAGLAALRNRDSTLRVEIRDGGQSTPTEVRFYTKVRFNTPLNMPGNNEAEMVQSAEGFYGKALIFT